EYAASEMPLSAFHPTVRRWFAERIGEPTSAQRGGWEAIRLGKHTLVAAPTGSGKTLAGFLSAIDALLSAPGELPDETRVLYLSPLKAPARDIEKNLNGPRAQLREMDPSLPEIRVGVRTGDTQPSARTAATRKPPHIFVTTPESLYILLTTESGRQMLST